MRLPPICWCVIVMCASAMSALPCECVANVPSCQDLGASSMIFVGKVLAIKQQISTYHPREQRLTKLVSFDVSEVFRGADAHSVNVVTGIGDGDCGFPFKVGDEYLVYTYADRAETVQSTGICTRTAAVNSAGEDLAFLRSLRSKGPEGKIFGYVSSRPPARWEKQADQGRISGVSVWIESSGRRSKEVTDSRGEYSFEDLLPGPYRLWADLPGKLGGGEPVDVMLSRQACRLLPFIAKELGSISGMVQDGNLQSVKHIWIELLRASDQQPCRIEDGFTDELGRYRIRGVPQGKYLMAVHANEPPRGTKHLWMPYERSYYPGVHSPNAAEVVAVESGQTVTAGNWMLGLPLEKRTIRGIVVGPDDKPASRVFVELKAEGYEDNADLAETRDDGKFALEGLSGMTYYVQASSGLRKGSEAWHCHRIVIPSGDEPIRIRLDRPGKDCDECRKKK